MAEHAYDVVILGAGPAGEVCAGRLAGGGLEVAVVEERLVGGECAFFACMPSKALLRPAQALDEARRIPGAAQAVDGALDAAAALARRDEVVHGLDDGPELPWLERRGIAVLRGRGRIEGERRVRVGDDALTARRAVVIATGSDATIPPIDGLADARPWTNREATTARRPPRRLAVLGGGPVAVELGQAWRRLGSEEVTLVQRGDRLLAREEAFAAEEVERALRDAGVDVRLGRQATRVRRNGHAGRAAGPASEERGADAAHEGGGGAGEVVLTLDDGSTVVADELLAALGRTPRTGDIGLETFGFEPGAPIPTDEHLRARGHPWLYAIGDANGRALLTHQGKEHARCVADHVLGRAGAAPVLDGPATPRVVFTEPQVAAVGLTLAAARDAGIDAEAVDGDVNAAAGGSFVGRGVPGRARLVVDRSRGVVVGATFTGADVSELVHAATVAIVGEVPLDRLRHAVPSFPTRSEVWLQLLGLA